ncbi:hypothetical protein [Arthrobacter sp. NPDC089319]|uniref:hypothetical protein n=1 Tax=Arthrobacter sp. NPDC089319 TaxID=3155915 RepID=UPI003425CDF4
MGQVGFPSFFHTLAAINYSDPITYKSSSSAVARRLSNNLAVSRNQWTDGEGRVILAAGTTGQNWHAAPVAL